MLVLDHLTSLFLVYLSVSSPSLSLLSHSPINHPHSTHVLSNSSVYCLIVLIRHLSSLTLTNTSSVYISSLKLIFFNPLHNHASNAFNLLISSCNNVNVSHKY